MKLKNNFFLKNLKKKSGMVGVVRVEAASIPLDMAGRPKVKKLIKIKMPYIPPFTPLSYYLLLYMILIN